MKKSNTVIRLKDISKFYYMGETVVKAVDGISIDVHEGSFVAIMGASGSGKSTSMNMVGSLDVPTKGNIFLDGKNISDMSESDLAQLRGKKIGFIFQQFNLIPNLTAKENITLPMIFQGTSNAQRNEKADQLLDLVDLKDRGDHYPNQLSGGQQQRVAIARSLANDPEVILADEPTGNLDSKTGEMVMTFLEKLNKQGKTIIMVTHDPDLAKKYASVAYWMSDGKITKVTNNKNNK
jgi:putative ABC transport system ATP-binding protein